MNVIITVADTVAPLCRTHVNTSKPLADHCTMNLINKRKRFIKIDKIRKNSANAPKIKMLNLEIRKFFATQTKNRVRSAVTGGNTNLWRAVKLSENASMDLILNAYFRLLFV